jgi:hypothetical protein
MEASGTSGKRGGLGSSSPASASSLLSFVGCVLSVCRLVAPLVSEKRVREKWSAKREAMRRMKRRERGLKKACGDMVSEKFFSFGLWLKKAVLATANYYYGKQQKIFHALLVEKSELSRGH